MSEILPIVSGILTGSILGWINPNQCPRAGALLAVLCGTTATIVSGESLISWGFLLIDIPLVAVCAAASFYLVAKRRWSGAEG